MDDPNELFFRFWTLKLARGASPSGALACHTNISSAFCFGLADSVLVQLAWYFE